MNLISVSILHKAKLRSPINVYPVDHIGYINTNVTEKCPARLLCNKNKNKIVTILWKRHINTSLIASTSLPMSSHITQLTLIANTQFLLTASPRKSNFPILIRKIYELGCYRSARDFSIQIFFFRFCFSFFTLSTAIVIDISLGSLAHVSRRSYQITQ